MMYTIYITDVSRELFQTKKNHLHFGEKLKKGIVNKEIYYFNRLLLLLSNPCLGYKKATMLKLIMI